MRITTFVKSARQNRDRPLHASCEQRLALRSNDDRFFEVQHAVVEPDRYLIDSFVRLTSGDPVAGASR
jgi:hypothetical protein